MLITEPTITVTVISIPSTAFSYIIFDRFSYRATAEHIAAMLSALRYRPSVCLSLCLSVIRVDQSKTVEVWIMKLSIGIYVYIHPSSFCGVSFIPKF